MNPGPMLVMLVMLMMLVMPQRPPPRMEETLAVQMNVVAWITEVLTYSRTPNHPHPQVSQEPEETEAHAAVGLARQ